MKEQNKDIKIKDKIRSRLLVMGQAIKTLDPTSLTSVLEHHQALFIFTAKVVYWIRILYISSLPISFR